MVKIELSLSLGKGDKPAGEPGMPSPQSKRPKRRFVRATILTAAILILIAAGVGVYVHPSHRQTTISSPFTAEVQSSVQFPLYYPTQAPRGYNIDSKTVTEPKAGIVLFQLKSQNGAIIYISEEARPEKFDLGGFYKQFTSFKSVSVSDGSIAAGYINGGQTEVASRANDKTWVLATTGRSVLQAQLISMMRSLTISY